MRFVRLVAIAVLELGGCDRSPARGEETPRDEPRPGAPELQVEEWVSGIGRPWDIAFLPDGTMLFTERTGRVRAVSAGAGSPSSGAPRTLLEPPSDLHVSGQSGMQGIAIDPRFAETRSVYVYLTVRSGDATENRVRRYRLDDAGDALVDDRDVLTGISWGNDGAHSGGRIRFGPDGHLWITTGDTRTGTVPQDLTVLGGKVLRITRDGEPAPGNPALAEREPGARPEIYFYGVRNPQGLAFQPRTGDPYICEHGPNEDDEVTRLVAGGNGGWNPTDGEGGYTGYTGARMSDTSLPDVAQPTFVLRDSEGMSDCAFLAGAGWGAWDGRLLVGLLAGNRALVVDVRSSEGDAPAVLERGRRIRAVVRGPDDAIYVALDEEPGVVWRVTPG